MYKNSFVDAVSLANYRGLNCYCKAPSCDVVYSWKELIFLPLNKLGQVNCYKSGGITAQEMFLKFHCHKCFICELRLKNGSTWSRIRLFCPVITMTHCNVNDAWRKRIKPRVGALAGYKWTNVMCNRMTHHTIPRTRSHRATRSAIPSNETGNNLEQFRVSMVWRRTNLKHEC